MWSRRLRSRQHHGYLLTSLQLPAVSGAGMGAATFVKEQLDAIGGISLEQFATCLGVSLAPVRALGERTQAPLVPALLCAVATPVLSEVGPLQGDDVISVSIAARVAGSALADVLAPLAPSQRRVHIETAVLRVVRELTGAPTAALAAETPLMEAGVSRRHTRSPCTCSSR